MIGVGGVVGCVLVVLVMSLILSVVVVGIVGFVVEVNVQVVFFLFDGQWLKGDFYVYLCYSKDISNNLVGKIVCYVEDIGFDFLVIIDYDNYVDGDIVGYIWVDFEW